MSPQPRDGHCRTRGDTVKDRKSEVDDNDDLDADHGVPLRHEVVSLGGVTIIRQTVKAVAGHCRNISVTAAGGIQGLNGTLPRRVTSRPIRARSYTHFDDRISAEDLVGFNVTPEEVAKRSFFPLLGYKRKVRKIDFSVFPPLVKDKIREIKYAGHGDSAVYSLYARKIEGPYEHRLRELSLGPVVLAYRGGIGYNVPFAKNLFDEIRKRGDCQVICLDISGFFDNIRHDVLKRNLLAILESDRLPPDWFKIYRRTTAYEYVYKEDIERAIGRIRGARICDIDNFRRIVRPLIKSNQSKFGIPQGTPLSGIFANISMIEFDEEMNRYIRQAWGSYRRYSDDIAIVLPIDVDLDIILSHAKAQISAVGLEFKDEKTCKTIFNLNSSGLHCGGDLMQYLGFTFDGSKILIRSESMKNFYGRMKTNIRRYVASATKRGIRPEELRKRVLVGRFTHWGDSRNFVQYAFRAAREMEAPEIKRQLRNHVNLFDRYWNRMLERYGTAAVDVLEAGLVS